MSEESKPHVVKSHDITLEYEKMVYILFRK